MTDEPLPSPSEDNFMRKPGRSVPAPFSPGSQWVKLRQRPFLQIVDNKRLWGQKLTLRILRVYLVLICHMDRRNVVNKCQKELASIIGMSPQAFSSALKQLEGNELIFRIGGRDKSRRIMLSAYFVGIGTEDEINKAGGEFHNRFSKGHDPKPSKRERARKDSDKNKGTE